MDNLNQTLAKLIVETLELEQLKPADIGPDDLLFGEDGIGLDSVDALELVVELERQFGVRLEENEESRRVLRSVSTLAEWIRSQKPPASSAA